MGGQLSLVFSSVVLGYSPLCPCWSPKWWVLYPVTSPSGSSILTKHTWGFNTRKRANQNPPSVLDIKRVILHSDLPLSLLPSACSSGVLSSQWVTPSLARPPGKGLLPLFKGTDHTSTIRFSKVFSWHLDIKIEASTMSKVLSIWHVLLSVAFAYINYIGHCSVQIPYCNTPL